ncbi:hypothetical protein WH47_04990 [Habropoda laboriosa]|uniref:Uncharacterized protein n=1 Tax=Habropoda laboriosa TaxID=597456 RepID=A0A0L7RJJ2_9HYME|nr:hypothetical protein WH47_04990 [Habropoda laboriosa]
MALSLIRGKGLQYGNTQLRFLSSISTMKKGLVLGIYETDDESNISLTPTAAKYDELVKGKLQKNILLRD